MSGPEGAEPQTYDQTIVPLSRMRRMVTRTVTASAVVPQYSVAVDIPFQKVLQCRDTMRLVEERASVSDVINWASAKALLKHENVNASFTGDSVELHSTVNLAFIVEVDDGMVGPTILDAANSTIERLVTERIRLTKSAKAGTLAPEELLNGTFTISNLGALGIHRFNAMVMPPQAGILAVGAPTETGQLTMTLTCDHRVIDGAPAARFLSEIVNKIDEGIQSEKLD